MARGARVGGKVWRPNPGDLDREPCARFSLKLGLRFAGLHGTKLGVGADRSAADPIAELSLDLGLDDGGIEVACGHQGGAFRPVVAPIEIYDLTGWRGLQHIHLTDRQALGRALVLQQERQSILVYPVARGVAGPLFRQHDSAFAVHGGRFNRQIAGSLTQ